jgi:hypothetical protein
LFLLSALGFLGVLFDDLRRKSVYWMSLAACFVAFLLLHYHRADNHRYLELYWCVALAVACATPFPTASIGRSARMLIGTVFLLATLWKVLSPAYISGHVWEDLMVFDRRFRYVASELGGLSAAAASVNLSQLRRLVAFDSVLTQVPMQIPGQLRALAQILVWWTLLIEGLVAVAFLVRRGALGRYRDHLLIGFAVSTYLLVPELSFGLILVVLGIAQAERSALRRWYLLLALYIIFMQGLYESIV